ncbi:MAG: TonB family protein, partial [Syntrophobacteraceae bacterium]
EATPEPPVEEAPQIPMVKEVMEPSKPKLVEKPKKQSVKPAPRKHPVHTAVRPKTIPPPSAPPEAEVFRAQHAGAGDSPPGETETGQKPAQLASAGAVRDGVGLGPVEASFGETDGPRFVRRVLPVYPRLAREMGKEGTVVLRLTIDERGQLQKVLVVKSAGSAFDSKALDAVKASSYSPAKKGGRPVLCSANLHIHFVLKGSEGD